MADEQTGQLYFMIGFISIYPDPNGGVSYRYGSCTVACLLPLTTPEAREIVVKKYGLFGQAAERLGIVSLHEINRDHYDRLSLNGDSTSRFY